MPYRSTTSLTLAGMATISLFPTLRQPRLPTPAEAFRRDREAIRLLQPADFNRIEAALASPPRPSAALVALFARRKRKGPQA